MAAMRPPRIAYVRSNRRSALPVEHRAAGDQQVVGLLRRRTCAGGGEEEKCQEAERGCNAHDRVDISATVRLAAVRGASLFAGLHPLGSHDADRSWTLENCHRSFAASIDVELALMPPVNVT